MEMRYIFLDEGVREESLPPDSLGSLECLVRKLFGSLGATFAGPRVLFIDL